MSQPHRNRPPNPPPNPPPGAGSLVSKFCTDSSSSNQPAALPRNASQLRDDPQGNTIPGRPAIPAQQRPGYSYEVWNCWAPKRPRFPIVGAPANAPVPRDGGQASREPGPPRPRPAPAASGEAAPELQGQSESVSNAARNLTTAFNSMMDTAINDAFKDAVENPVNNPVRTALNNLISTVAAEEGYSHVVRLRDPVSALEDITTSAGNPASVLPNRSTLGGTTPAAITLTPPIAANGSIYIRNPMSYAARRNDLRRATHSLRYACEGVPPHKFMYGVSPEMLLHYAGNTMELLNTENTFIIPACFYSNKDAWPYKQNLRDGRPFYTIFSWIRSAFASPLEKVYFDIDLKVDSLCAHLSACHYLGMKSLIQQLESAIKHTLQSRPLDMNELKAIWYHHLEIRDPNPGILTIPSGFLDKELMLAYAQNLRELTIPNLTAKNLQAEATAFLCQHIDLCKLLNGPDIGTWIGIVERRPDREWSKARLHAWVAENGQMFGLGKAVQMPKIVALY